MSLDRRVNMAPQNEGQAHDLLHVDRMVRADKCGRRSQSLWKASLAIQSWIPKCSQPLARAGSRVDGNAEDHHQPEMPTCVAASQRLPADSRVPAGAIHKGSSQQCTVIKIIPTTVPQISGSIPFRYSSAVELPTTQGHHRRTGRAPASGSTTGDLGSSSTNCTQPGQPP